MSTASTPRWPVTARGGQLLIEPFLAVADICGWKHRCDVFALQGLADDIVRPLQDRPVRPERETITLGHVGLYPASCRHAEASSQRYGIDVRTVLIAAGKRLLVGG